MTERIVHTFPSKFLIYLFFLFLLNLTVLSFSFSSASVSWGEIVFYAISQVTLTGFSPPDFYHTLNGFGIWAYIGLMQINALFCWMLIFYFARRVIQLTCPDFVNFKSLLGFLILFEILLAGAFFYSVSGGFEFSTLAQKLHFCWAYGIASLSNFRVGLLDHEWFNYTNDDLLVFNLFLYGGALFGSLGFLAITDLIHPLNLRERLKNPKIDWRKNTKIALFGTLALIGIGSLFFIIAEYDQYLTEKVFLEKIFSGAFLSVKSRLGESDLAEFNDLTASSLVMFLFLMMVGGSLFSTTGGLKISFFFLLFKRNCFPKLISILLLVLAFQFISIWSSSTIFPEHSFRERMIIQFSAFFNVGVGKITVLNPMVLFYLSVEMLFGRILVVLLPWFIFTKINIEKTPETIIS